MSPPTIHDALRHEIDALPARLAEEVLDFILFVKSRHAEEVYLWQQIETTYAYRTQHPETVTTVTVQEWQEAMAYLDSE